MGLFGRHSQQPPEPEFLKPGECECGHGRCYHRNGKHECGVAITTDSHDKDLPKSEWGECACKLYIPDDDGGDDDAPDVPVDPEVAELERMIK
jgi:hypothetical protein